MPAGVGLFVCMCNVHAPHTFRMNGAMSGEDARKCVKRVWMRIAALTSRLNMRFVVAVDVADAVAAAAEAGASPVRASTCCSG